MITSSDTKTSFASTSMKAPKPLSNKIPVPYFAYKGFDSKLQCKNDFQYTVGDTYVTSDNISVCNAGFHFCAHLEDVNAYYSFDRSGNRYCLVEVLGDVQVHRDGKKSCTNKIKIIRELSKVEIFKQLNKKYWNKAFEFQQRYPQALIGGSMSLILKGLMEENRKIRDIDIVMPTFDVDLLKSYSMGEISAGSSSDVHTSLYDCADDIKIDIFINPADKPEKITTPEGRTYYISDTNITLQAKMKYALVNKKSAKKHLSDLLQCLLNLKNNTTVGRVVDFTATDIHKL